MYAAITSLLDMKNIPWIFLIALILLASLLNAQSGWIKEKGALYAQSGFFAFSSRNYYNIDGLLLNEGGAISTRIFSVYGEYGLSSRVTMAGNFPWLVQNKFSTSNTVSGVGDIRLDLRYGINQQKLPISFAIGVELPTGKKNLLATAKEPNAFGVVERINLPTGDGEWNLLATVAVSRSFWAGRGYGSAFSTYNLRTQNYSGQVRLGLELGAQPFSGLWVFGKLFTQLKGLEGSSNDLSFFRAEGTTFTQLSFGGQYMVLQQWGVTASFFLPVNNFVTEFKNIYTAPAFSLGLVYQSK